MDDKGKAPEAPPDPTTPMAKPVPKRPALTHFLCIPLLTPASRPQLAASLASFRREVASAPEKRLRVPDGAVRPLGTLHLTLGVMSLQGERLEEAAGLLRGLRMGELVREAREEEAGRAEAAAARVGGATEVADRGMEISLRGLRSMQKASQAAVLYAPVDTRGVLRPFCERLRARFLEAGLIVDDERPLLLHATVVNTVYVRGGARGKGRKRVTLDAQQLLDRYEDYVWLEGFVVDRVAICKMGAKEVPGGEEGGGDEEGDGAAYEVVAEAEI